MDEDKQPGTRSSWFSRSLNIKKFFSKHLKLLFVLFFSVLLFLLYNFLDPLEKVNLFKKQVVQTVDLTDGFPEVPVYPEADLIGSFSEPNSDGIYYQSIWEADESVSDISKWYIKSLQDSGWAIEVKPADLKAEDIQNIISIKGGSTLNLGIIKRAEKEKVEISAEFFPENAEE